MKKIPTIFKRDENNRSLVTADVNPEAAWVFAGEGVATRKYDGTCCMVRDHKLFKRYDAKNGRTPPPGFEPAQEPDPVTGHQPGWLPVGSGPDDRYFRDAIGLSDDAKCPNYAGAYGDGTYELIGPKVQGNPENASEHLLIAHSEAEEYKTCPLTFDLLKDWLSDRDIEGIVFHHPDGRMAKIKVKDFGYVRGKAHS